MSERYSRLFTLPENLYAAGSPVVIAAGALLKDNHTGKIVAQLKLRSISNKIIRAVKVSLSLFDTAGNPIGNVVEYEYLDLDASRDTEFGQKNPVFVAESKARSYKAAVTEVVFADKTTWTASDADWEPLPRQKTLDAVLVNAELIKQYKITVGSNLSYYPLEEKDLWYCACGALNRENESCHTCHRSLFELQTIDLEQLSKDRDARLVQEAAVAEAKAAAERVAAEAAKKKVAKILKVVIPTVCAVVAVTLLTTKVIIPNSKYNKAVNLMDAGQYEEAIAAFEAMDGYKDSAAQIKYCEDAIAAAEQARAEEEKAAEEARIETEKAAAYTEAEMLANNGETAKAAIAFSKIHDYRDSAARCMECWSDVKNLTTINSGYFHTVGLKEDGSVIAVGYNDNRCSVDQWRDIVSIVAGSYHTVGLKIDGTVTAVGKASYGWGQCNVEQWSDIIAVDAGTWFTIGLKSDGTVVTVGKNGDAQCNLKNWSDIVAISAEGSYAFGLKSDGTVVAFGPNEHGQCDVNNWNNIVKISAGGGFTVGLKSDGTVVAVGYNENGQCNVNDWNNIIAVSAGIGHTVALKSDGTVVATGENGYGQCNVDDWRDIVAVCAKYGTTIGLKSDGTLVATGDNRDGQCNVSDWTDIKLPN